MRVTIMAMLLMISNCTGCSKLVFLGISGDVQMSLTLQVHQSLSVLQPLVLMSLTLPVHQRMHVPLSLVLMSIRP